jgi:hypothetical protein
VDKHAHSHPLDHPYSDSSRDCSAYQHASTNVDRHTLSHRYRNIHAYSQPYQYADEHSAAYLDTDSNLHRYGDARAAELHHHPATRRRGL